MPVYEATELREERAGLFDQMCVINDKAEEEKRDLLAEEAGEYDKLETAFDALEKRIKRTEQLEGIKPQLRKADVLKTDETDEEEKREIPKTLKEFRAQRRGELPQDTDEYREAWFHLMTAKDPREITSEEQRVLSKATAGAGLNLVPTDFEKTLVELLRDFGVMRQISKVITTSNGDDLQVPSVTTHGTAAWTAESAAFTASDEVFGQATLKAYKAATIILVSDELLTDSAFDLESYISQEFAERIGVLENTAYQVGTGPATQPTGIATDAPVGKTGAAGQTATIIADDLFDLFHSVLPPYRRNASWVANDATIKAVRKLKDTTNQYLWNPGLQAGQPDTLLGSPVYADPDVAVMAVSAKSVFFGDFSYYWIRDVQGIAFQRLVERYAELGQVGFRAYHRTDGKLLRTVAVKHYVNAAA